MTDEHVETHDFDAFWASHGPTEHVRIKGELVELPKDVPLWLVMRATDATTQDASEVRRMVGVLYGEDTLDRWTERGLGVRQLSVILAWTIARAQGSQITFAEAARRVEQVMSLPPASTRQQRRAQGKKRKRKN